MRELLLSLPAEEYASFPTKMGRLHESCLQREYLSNDDLCSVKYGGSTWSDGRVLRWLVVVGVLLLALVAGAFGCNEISSGSVAQQTAPQVTGYTVQAGDTLWDCAEKVTPNGGDVSQTVDRLMEINNLSSSQLVPGQHLRVPGQ